MYAKLVKSRIICCSLLLFLLRLPHLVVFHCFIVALKSCSVVRTNVATICLGVASRFLFPQYKCFFDRSNGSFLLDDLIPIWALIRRGNPTKASVRKLLQIDDV